MKTNYSCILCIADMHITGDLERILSDLAIPEVFIQRAKQMSLTDKQAGFLGLRQDAKLEESRALLYRIYIPSVYETGFVKLITEATDMKMGGRGSILAQRIGLFRFAASPFDTEKLEKSCGKSDKLPEEDHALITCIVPRGQGNLLAEAVLEMGICVPVIFFGTGVGRRDRLGLMRITVPVEKEIIWFIVPSSDASLVEKTVIPLARLDIPGRGFIYKTYVHAPAVNLRIRQRKRIHAATMEQVIAVLDEVRGSSDWRRIASKKQEIKSKSDITRALFYIGEEEDVELFRKAAMENGARGATLSQIEARSYSAQTHEQAMESHSRSLCDIVTYQTVEEKLMEYIAHSGFFDSRKSSVIKTFDAEIPAALKH
ncbi:MAG: hypothetical protein FWG89_07630 [Treponema sp.]|nr:hypothetical protein [Treponema sp.]